MNYILVMTTTPDYISAREIAKHIVSKKLCACVNIIPTCLSIFEWNDEIQENNEVIMLIKTMETRFDELVIEIKKPHTYDLPEIIKINISDGDNDYLRWIQDKVKINM
ncbi:MAG: divalent-cation tolerance protein CutA [Neisseriaceae bacterium]